MENKANLNVSKKMYGTERKTDNISTYKSSLKNSCSAGSRSPTHLSFTNQSNENIQGSSQSFLGFRQVNMVTSAHYPL